jgi:hypothetical protein
VDESTRVDAMAVTLDDGAHHSPPIPLVLAVGDA